MFLDADFNDNTVVHIENISITQESANSFKRNIFYNFKDSTITPGNNFIENTFIKSKYDINIL